MGDVFGTQKFGVYRQDRLAAVDEHEGGEPCVVLSGRSPVCQQPMGLVGVVLATVRVHGHVFDQGDIVTFCRAVGLWVIAARVDRLLLRTRHPSTNFERKLVPHRREPVNMATDNFVRD